MPSQVTFFIFHNPSGGRLWRPHFVVLFTRRLLDCCILALSSLSIPFGLWFFLFSLPTFSFSCFLLYLKLGLLFFFPFPSSFLLSFISFSSFVHAFLNHTTKEIQDLASEGIGTGIFRREFQGDWLGVSQFKGLLIKIFIFHMMMILQKFREIVVLYQESCYYGDWLLLLTLTDLGNRQEKKAFVYLLLLCSGSWLL